MWGFPTDGCPVDGSATVVTYAASEAAGASARCADNLKASYVLLSDIGSTKDGRATLSEAMNLCTPLDTTADVSILMSYLQTPLFDLSEGSYPFPSDYITYALTGSTNPLPPWAMQVMCEPLGADFGVAISGDTSKVDFTVSSGNVQVFANWDKTTNNKYTQADVASSGAPSLLASVAQSIQVWYNVSGDQPSCIDWKGVSGKKNKASKRSAAFFAAQQSHQLPRHSVSKHAAAGATPASVTTKAAAVESSGKTSTTNTCTMAAKDLDPGTAWNALTCNEGINLINWWAQGVGNDLYWPPNQAQDYSTESLVPGSMAYCPYLKGLGLYGVPDKADDHSFWLDTAYGGTRMQYASNIVYSNGNLDPWSPAGVALTESPAAHKAPASRRTTAKRLSKDGSVVSVLIDMGGHHLDLFWPTDQDPQSVRYALQLNKYFACFFAAASSI